VTEHNVFYYFYSSLTHAQIPLSKVDAALYFEELYILDPVNASWATIGVDHHACDAVTQLPHAGILETVTPGDFLAKYVDPMMDAIRGDVHDQAFLKSVRSARRRSLCRLRRKAPPMGSVGRVEVQRRSCVQHE
jgi:hypothetical protein